MIDGFRGGKRLSLSSATNAPTRSTRPSFMRALFEQEGQGLFDVRHAILGHLQQGGDPSPFDRILATRLAARCILFLIGRPKRARQLAHSSVCRAAISSISRLDDCRRMVDAALLRPQEQWWLDLRPIARLLSQFGTEEN